MERASPSRLRAMTLPQLRNLAHQLVIEGAQAWLAFEDKNQETHEAIARVRKEIRQREKQATRRRKPAVVLPFKRPHDRQRRPSGA